VNNKNVVKLVLATNSRRRGVPVIRNSAVLPQGEKVVTYVMILDHIQPDEAMKIFNSVVSGLNPQGSIVSVPNTSSLIITENTSLIKNLIALKKKIDIPQELSTKKTIELQHADAEEIATQLQEIMDFSAEQNSLVSNSNTPVNTSVNKKPATGAKNPNNKVSKNPSQNQSRQNFASVKILAITRTNSLWIMGRPIDIKFAETIIADFDKPIKRRSYYRHKLRFLSVSEFLPIANNAIRRKEGGSKNQSGQSSGAPSAGRSSSASSDGSLAESERLEYPESILVGKTLLVADNANNSLIVQGPPQSISLIQDLIQEMDIASEQVQITAIFGRYNLDNDSDFGVDFARLTQSRGGRDSSIAFQNRTGYPLLVDPSSLQTTTTDADGVSTTINSIPESIAGLTIYGKIGTHFLPTLRALQSSGNFKLLARPSIFTTNNKKAVISSGQSIAVPTNTLSQNTGVVGNVSQSTNIEFKNVLLKLEVIPLVNSKDEVTLQISFTNDDIIGNQIIDGNSIPTIGKEELLTTVTIPNGGTIALGGLITERNVNSKSGIPILSKIPGLGRLFTSTSKQVKREELVIFIQPRIISNKDDLESMKENNQRYSKVSREAGSALLLPPLKDNKAPEGGKDNPRDNRFRSKRR
jgi:general secretion pathway protein D